jgi:hypothetical protein
VLSGVTILTDTDNTGESATAHYSDIIFNKATNSISMASLRSSLAVLISTMVVLTGCSTVPKSFRPKVTVSLPGIPTPPD